MLMLVHLPIHVGVCVGVDVCVDLGIDLGSESRASLDQEKLLLLLSYVVLVGQRAQTLFIPTGHGAGGEGSVARGRALGCRQGRGGGAVAFRLAEPEEGGAEDEDHARWDADDDRPG